ncbi:hypothetical protein [Nostoc sp.]|uniref:hypothetical protein n=1 Tax=Nostoc sp. TaxID=1180 RepID=UPI002FF542E7
MKGLKVVLLFCAVVYPFSSVIGSKIALADTPISSCINSLLYTSTPWGAERTKLSEQTVASVCKGVTTQEEASSIKNCIDSLLYTNTPWGAERTQTSEETAINACAISRITPQNNSIPGNNTIIVVPGGNPTLPSTPQR